MNKTTGRILVSAFLLFSIGCGEAETHAGPGTGGEATGGTGGAGGAGGTNTTSSTSTGTWDGGNILGFGYVSGPEDEAPFSAQEAFAEHSDTGNPPALASSPIIVPVDGYIVTVTVVHVVKSSLGGCGTTERHVLVSVPTTDQIPHSPAVYQDFVWNAEEILAAPPYTMKGQQLADARVLTRTLDKPLHVKAGEVVHIGSLLDSEPVCALAAYELLDGSYAPQGDAYCTQGLSWSGCGGLPYPGANSWIAYVAWVTFAVE